jgi:enoyl-CoA hydratase
LSTPYFHRAAILAEMYSPQEAIAPGFLDRVTSSDQLLGAARETAAALSKLDMPAHAATKLRVRGPMLEALAAAITSELA